jgi:hypothetical protein
MQIAIPTPKLRAIRLIAKSKPAALALRDPMGNECRIAVL